MSGPKNNTTKWDKKTRTEKPRKRRGRRKDNLDDLVKDIQRGWEYFRQTRPQFRSYNPFA